VRRDPRERAVGGVPGEGEANHSYGRYDLLCLDELGYLHLDSRGAELLFQVLTEREEKASIAVASNAPFSEWARPSPIPGWPPRSWTG